MDKGSWVGCLALGVAQHRLYLGVLFKCWNCESHRGRHRGVSAPDTTWAELACGAQGPGTDEPVPPLLPAGVFQGPDLCCQEHDHCPKTVSPFQYNYGIRNYRFHTISHCSCDARLVSGGQGGLGARGGVTQLLGAESGLQRVPKDQPARLPCAVGKLSFNRRWDSWTSRHLAGSGSWVVWERSQVALSGPGTERQLWGRFQQCLQNQRDSVSDIVGVVFFNVLAIPCFVLEEQEACVEWYWWGGYVGSPFDPLPSQGGGAGPPRLGGRPVCMSVLQGTMSCPVLPVLSSGRGWGPQDTDIPWCPVQPSGLWAEGMGLAEPRSPWR